MSPTADEIVAAAVSWIGTPYRHQASTPAAGCDCLGLVRGVWRMLYGAEPWTLPPYRAHPRGGEGNLAEAAERWLAPAEELAAGRVVLFRLVRTLPPRHCGVMIADGRFVHAQERIGVVAADLTEAWRRRVAGVFGFPERG